MMRELHALALVRAGRADRAREVLGAWREQPPLARDYLEIGLNALRSRTWIALARPGGHRRPARPAWRRTPTSSGSPP